MDQEETKDTVITVVHAFECIVVGPPQGGLGTLPHFAVTVAAVGRKRQVDAERNEDEGHEERRHKRYGDWDRQAQQEDYPARL